MGSADQNLNFVITAIDNATAHAKSISKNLTFMGDAGMAAFAKLNASQQLSLVSLKQLSAEYTRLAAIANASGSNIDAANTEKAALKYKALQQEIRAVNAELIRNREIVAANTGYYTTGLGIKGGEYQAMMQNEALKQQMLEKQRHLAGLPQPVPLFGQELQDHGNKISALGTKYRQAGMNITMGLTLPLALVGGAALGAASQYETAMEQIRSQTGGTVQEVALMKEEMLKLAKTTEFTPVQLSQALFQVESVDIRGPRAVAAMEAATMGATAGQADLVEVTRALSAALTSQVDGTKSAIQVMGLMNSIVAHGRLDMDQFAASMGTGVLAAAKNFGISLTDLGSAMVVMTNSGVGAQESATRLRMTFSLLSSPSDKAAGVLKQIGIETLDIAHAIRSGGLIEGLTLLKTKLEAFSDDPAERARVISEAFGGGRSSTTLVTLLDQLDNVKKAHVDIANGAGDLQASYDNMMDTFGFKWRNFVAQLQVQAIKLGEALIPFATFLMNNILPLVESFVTILTSLPGPIQKIAVALLAITVVSGPLLVVVGAFLSMYGVVLQLGGAVFKTAQAFMLLQGYYGSVRVAGAALISTFSAMQLSMLGLVAVILALEGINRAFGGHGLIDLFTNDHAEAERAAKSMEQYGHQVEKIQKMVAAGSKEPEALEFVKNETVAHVISNLMKIKQAREQYAEAMSKPITSFNKEVIRIKIDNQTDEFKENLKNSLNEIEKMGLSGSQLKEIGITLFPILEQPGNFEALSKFKQIMFDQLEVEEAVRDARRDALGKSGFTDEQIAAIEATEALTEATDAYAASLKNAMAILETTDPQTEFLKTQIAAWERRRAEMDLTGESTAHADNMIAGLNARLAVLDATLSSDSQLLSFYQANMTALRREALQADGDLILLANTLKQMPEDLKIKLDLLMPDLEIHRLMALLDALAHANGSVIRIKLALEAAMLPAAAMAPSEAEWAFARGLGGEAGAQAEAALTRRQKAAEIQGAFDYQNRIGTGGDAGVGARLNAGAPDAADNLNKTEFGLMELSKAFAKFNELTGSKSIPAFKEWLELQKKLAEAQDAANLRAEQAANPLLAMSMAFAAIRTRVLETNGTIETFLRDDVFMPALSKFKSALSDIFGEPPREVQELELKKAHLELERLERVRGGAKPKDLKDLDKQIEAIDAEIAIISKRVDIYKKTAELMDQTIKTEQEVLDASIILGQIIFNASSSVRLLDGAATFAYLTLINLGNAFNEGAATQRSGAATAIQQNATAQPGTNVTINLSTQAQNRAQIKADVMKALDEAFIFDTYSGNSVT